MAALPCCTEGTWKRSAAPRVDWPVYPRRAEHNTVAEGGNRRWAETAGQNAFQSRWPRGRPEDPRLRAPHSPPRLARKRPRPGRLASPPSWKAQKAALGHRPAERASCERQRPGGSTVVISIPCQRLVAPRLAVVSQGGL